MSKNARMMENIELQQFYDRFYGKKSSSMQNERVLTITASAMGRLYKELIKTIGIERTKGFLLRYGWNCGVSDALNIVDTYGRKEECLAVGPLIHTMHGFQDGHKIDRLEVDFAKGKLNLEGIWWNSYEALQYIKLFGKSSEPICHTLTGLASGYLSTIMEEKVIAKEVECQAMGHSHCRVVCRTVKDWGKEIEAELKFYEIDDLIQELDQTYEQLKKERDNLNRTFDVHEKLMKEILRDTSLNSLAELLYKTTNLPAVIEDINHQILAVAGMPEDDKEIKQLLSLQHTNKTKYFHISDELGVTDKGFCP